MLLLSSTLTTFGQSTHLDYIISAANLHAVNYGLNGSTDINYFKKVADAVIVPEFQPKKDVKIQIKETDAPQESGPGKISYPQTSCTILTAIS